jgi:hypothetical protein
MPLFTMMLEYRGTSAISQARAPSAKAAAAKWAQEFDYAGTLGVGDEAKAEMMRDFSRETPIPVKHTSNAWCSTGLGSGHMALLYIVQTSEATKKKR